MLSLSAAKATQCQQLKQQAGTEDAAYECHTPQQNKLSAPGANIALEAPACHQQMRGQAGRSWSCRQANSDPILCTVGHQRATWRDAVVPRQKAGPKSYATLSLRRAPAAAPEATAQPALVPPVARHAARKSQPLNTANSCPSETQHLQKPLLTHIVDPASGHTYARHPSADSASHARTDKVHANSIGTAFHAAETHHHQAAGPSARSPVCNSQDIVSPSSAAVPLHMSQQGPGAHLQNMSIRTAPFDLARSAVAESQTQPDPQTHFTSRLARSPPATSSMQEPVVSQTSQLANGAYGHAVSSSFVHSPSQHHSASPSVPHTSGNEAHCSLSDDIVDCCIDMPGPILALVAKFR